MEGKNIVKSIKLVIGNLEWLSTHNKNYTKEQYFKIVDSLDELKSLIVKKEE